MANKLQQRAQKSKLQDLDTKPEEKIFPVNRSSNSSVRSFRLDEASWQDLQSMVEQLNNISKRKVSTSRLVKALIYLGKNSSDDKLVKALKETAV